MSLFALFVSSFVSIGPEKPYRRSGKFYLYFNILLGPFKRIGNAPLTLI